MIDKIQLKEDKVVAWLLLAFSTILILFSSGFSPIYGFNDWPDVNVYFNIGRAMMDGQVLYKDIFDHKGSFIFLLYGFGSLIPCFVGILLIQITFFFVSLWFVYKIGCLYLGRVYAFFVAVVYSLYFLLYNGSGGSAEELALPFFLISFYFFLKYVQKGGVHDPFWMLIHGMMVSFVFFIKLNLVGFWIFVPMFFIYFLIKKDYHLILRNLITLVLGAFLVVTPTFFYFYFTDSLYDFYHSYIDFNLLYGLSSIDYAFFIELISQFFKFSISHYMLMGVVLLGLCMFAISKRFVQGWGLKLILLSTFIATFCVVFMSPAVFGYYYMPLTVFTILGIVFVIYYFLEKKRRLEFSMVYTAGTAAMVLVVLITFLNKKDKVQSDLKRDFITSFAAEIKKEPKNKQTLLCLGLNSGVCLFTEADIMPTVKYFFTPNIKKEVYPAINDAQRAYIENKALTFVIVRDKFRDYQTLLPYLQANYDIKKTYSIGEQVYYLYKRK